MAVSVEPIYLGDQIVDKGGLITERMRLLWQQVIDGFTKTSAKGSLTRSNQTAALATTSVVTLTSGGKYRLSYYLRKTIADGVSSSAAVTFGWSDNAAALTEAFAALATDTSTAHQSGSILVNADTATDVTVAVAYASNTPGAMAYSIAVTVEPVQ